MNAARLTPPASLTSPGLVQATIPLASSKSESNRALIIDALTGFQSDLHNLSTARDTQTMIRLLKSDDNTADVLDAGTTMRFLTAYFAATGQSKTMTGTPRMCERPIGILVDALRTLGADITYLNKDGYPPLQLNGFKPSDTNRVQIRGDVSSQYISALLMIAPTLPNGLTLELTGAIGSRPYIEMTLEQMICFGADVQADWDSKTITVAPRPYTPTNYTIESDWSGASYWYSVAALALDETAEIFLLGLKPKSLQGDSAIVSIMRLLGVESTFTEQGVRLTKRPAAESLAWDFTDCPDLAQTVAVCAAVKGITLRLTGIESLKIKETDRVAALQAELQKIGAELVEIETNHRYEVRRMDQTHTVPAIIKTYDDHRMAMAFAPVAMREEIIIEEPGVVAKSYPSFWDDMARVATVEFVSAGQIAN
ncbi:MULTISPECIES: 3-phosphoshikimate 1-carboxyvinyltransferase [unclassified Spirosoma]|uniref:3-phosphoshikimate 1-carboxyvinyltransferase n=1 Tax=unclassified Spirosoma TaxID=2621999 RepID=UPI00095F55CB|nr:MULTISPECIES: 3-phosphoshikimate 1-carboxyvinyltransferase [unclassified Spirosoma]MBN8823632.1 3-phosphoshikimate 1-carboxyvinyltransferase [Spirosoma sp.]OJW76810.1 MAG: 3-phosphoshikimate 1-carboxyvinyltransferase [Spirosoma sp. 48-14]